MIAYIKRKNFYTFSSHATSLPKNVCGFQSYVSYQQKYDKTMQLLKKYADNNKLEQIIRANPYQKSIKGFRIQSIFTVVSTQPTTG